MLKLASHWASLKLICCCESPEIGHFNVVMETRCDRATIASYHITLEIPPTVSSWPAFLFFFFFKSNCYPSFTFPSPSFGQPPVTSPSLWEVNAAAGCSCGLGEGPTRTDKRALFTWPGRVTTPTQTHMESSTTLSAWLHCHTLQNTPHGHGRLLLLLHAARSVS